MKPEDTTCIVVLGMHGGGTSLVAYILHTLGVNMHPNPKAHVNDYLNYEDSAFVRMNARILHKAGGNFRNPPSPERIISVQSEVESDIISLVTQRADSSTWGWKDPRTAITIPLYHPHLPNPYYIFVTRNPKHVARSMMSRAGKRAAWGKPPGFWNALAQEYYRRVGAFLLEVNPPNIVVDYGDLVGRRKDQIVAGIAYFVGADPRLVPSAIQCVRPKR